MPPQPLGLLYNACPKNSDPRSNPLGCPQRHPMLDLGRQLPSHMPAFQVWAFFFSLRIVEITHIWRAPTCRSHHPRVRTNVFNAFKKKHIRPTKATVTVLLNTLHLSSWCRGFCWGIYPFFSRPFKCGSPSPLVIAFDAFGTLPRLAARVSASPSKKLSDSMEVLPKTEVLSRWVFFFLM